MLIRIAKRLAQAELFYDEDTNQFKKKRQTIHDYYLEHKERFDYMAKEIKKLIDEQVVKQSLDRTSQENTVTTNKIYTTYRNK